MTTKICPGCRQDNALENDFCGGCGVRLETALAARPDSPLVIGKSSRLPAPIVRQALGAAAAGLLTLAANVGLAWLRRRAGAESAPTVIRPAPLRSQKPHSPSPAGEERAALTIFSRRVVQVWENGRLRGRGVDESVWQWHEEI